MHLPHATTYRGLYPTLPQPQVHETEIAVEAPMQGHADFDELRRRAGAKAPGEDDRKRYAAHQFAQQNLSRVFASCEKNAVRDRAAALKAVAPYLLPGDIPDKFLDRLVTELQDGRLTINVDLRRFDLESFENSGGRYTNKFDRAVPASRERDPYARAQFEDRLFRMGELYASSPHAAQGRFFNADGNRNAEFHHESRPIYAALDFAKDPGGGAHSYGRSYAVLSDGLKHAATFLPQDSLLYLDLPDLGHLSTLFHFENLIARLPDSRYGHSLMKQLVHQVRTRGQASSPTPPVSLGDRMQGYRPRPDRHYGQQNNYIDASVHATVSFRDFQEIHLSMGELRERYPDPVRRDTFIHAVMRFDAEHRDRRGRALFHFHE